jgi:hypothetical protein
MASVRWDRKAVDSFVGWALDDATAVEEFATALREVPTEDWPLCAVRVRVPLFGPMPGEPKAIDASGGGELPATVVTPDLLSRADRWYGKQRAFREEEDSRPRTLRARFTG